MGNTQIADMVLTQTEKDNIAKNAVEQAENEEAGISIMIPFMKFANKTLFANSHYVKKADKGTGKMTDKTVLNLALFVKLGNKALEELKSSNRIEATWNGQIGFVNYDPDRRDIQTDQ